jgi:hypothetical protein
LPALGIDLRPVARADQRDVRGFDQRDELVKRRRQPGGHEPQRDRELAVRRFTGARLGRQPGILVAVEHQKADASLGVLAQACQGAEYHRAVASNQQEPVALMVRAERVLARGLDQIRERSLVEQSRRTTDAGGVLETKVPCVDHP